MRHGTDVSIQDNMLVRTPEIVEEDRVVVSEYHAEQLVTLHSRSYYLPEPASSTRDTRLTAEDEVNA